jgi:hypothetical protein
LFRTTLPDQGGELGEVGIDGSDVPQDWIGQHLWPLRRQAKAAGARRCAPVVRRDRA